MRVRIDHLFEHSQHLRLVATWIYEEFWRGRAGYSVEGFEALLRQAGDPDRIPLSLLAILDGEPAGTVNLIESDSPRHPHLHPWLAAPSVGPAHRRQGVGGALCRALVSDARRLGFTEVFLGTDVPGFYAALGAELHEQVADTLSIMRFRTADAFPVPAVPVRL